MQAVLQDTLIILDTIPEAYAHVDSDFRLTLVNRAAEQLFGTSRAELIGKTLWRVYPAIVGTFLEAGFRRAMAERTAVTLDNSSASRRRWYAITAMPDSSGGLVVRFADNKADKLEDALRKSEEKFSKAFQLNPTAMAIVDLISRTYLDVNDAFQELTGYQRDETVGRSWSELSIWVDHAQRDESILELMHKGKLLNCEFQFRKKSGVMGMGLLCGELMKIDGRVCAITATIDITERLQLESKLRQAQKLEGVGRLAGGVAHDLNNLLTIINGYSDFILKASHPTDPLYLHAQEIKKAGTLAAGLTKQLLAFSRKQG
jgi:PAS domain S-box-containing protein